MSSPRPKELTTEDTPKEAETRAQRAAEVAVDIGFILEQAAIPYQVSSSIFGLSWE